MDYFWLSVGLLGNVTFGSRFFLQWIASERAGKSTVPTSFWFFSLLGSAVLLVFACHIWASRGWKDGVPLILSYGPNMIPYVRNIMLIRKEKRLGAAARADERPPADVIAPVRYAVVNG
jgi:lipid-A-disaccharide synthase-like uncharacterized protein